MIKNMKIISLGSACELSDNLKRLFLKKETNFFDYLMNANAGLINVVDIIKNNFADFTDGFFIKIKSEEGQEVIVHKKYRNLAFLHYDMFDKNILTSFDRKIKRFKKILKSKAEVIFMYYRAYAIAIDNNVFFWFFMLLYSKIKSLIKLTIILCKKFRFL